MSLILPTGILTVEQAAQAQAVAERLRSVYAEAQDYVDRLHAATTEGQFRRRAQLEAARRQLDEFLDDTDRQAALWVRTELPQVYAMGHEVGTGGAALGVRFGQADRRAVTTLAVDTYDDLLGATTHMRASAKTFIREAARITTGQGVLAGQSLGEMRRRLTTLVQRGGIHAVIYRDGSKHSLREYADVVLRTKTAVAYNEGLLNGAGGQGVEWFEVVDGLSCGWTGHDTPDQARGSIRSRRECRANPIAHPNCRRSFIPRPDIRSKADAKAGKPISEVELDPADPPMPRGSVHRAQQEAKRQATVDAHAVAAPPPVDPEILARAAAELPAMRSAILADGRRSAVEARDWLERADALRMAKPPRLVRREGRWRRPGPGGEWDWLDRIGQKERQRLARWFDDSPAARQHSGPDQIADNIRLAHGIDDHDEAMAAWQEQTQIADAGNGLGFVRTGRTYDYIDLNRVAPRVAADGYDVATVLGTDDVAAINHIADVWVRKEADEAFRILSRPTTEGPPPWRMSLESFEDEVRELEYDLENLVEVPERLRRRYAELVPDGIEDADTPWGFERLHAELVRLARLAGLE